MIKQAILTTTVCHHLRFHTVMADF